MQIPITKPLITTKSYPLGTLFPQLRTKPEENHTATSRFPAALGEDTDLGHPLPWRTREDLPPCPRTLSARLNEGSTGTGFEKTKPYRSISKGAQCPMFHFLDTFT